MCSYATGLPVGSSCFGLLFCAFICTSRMSGKHFSAHFSRASFLVSAMAEYVLPITWKESQYLFLQFSYALQSEDWQGHKILTP